MFDLKESGSLRGNVAYAVVAQAVSLISSILMTVAVPKILDVEGYAYWQLFTLYVGYMGLLLIGVHDGIFLRLGGQHIDRVDERRVHAEYLLVLAFQIGSAFALAIASWLLDLGQARTLVLFLVCLCAGLVNPVQFLYYVFRAVNIPNVYSKATVLSQSAFMLLLVVAVASQASSPWVYIGIYVICQCISVVYCYLYARPILRSAPGELGVAVADAREDIIAGLKVTIAYYAGTLVVGASRMMIDARWGLEAFGQFSLSVSLVNFLLAFAAQVSMVAFPVVKRMGKDQGAGAFHMMRRMLLVAMPLVYVLYYPGCWLLGMWLPQYADSLRYLAIILPICVFDCKMQLLVNTYLKALRKESAMLYINVGCLFMSVFLGAVAVFLVGDLYLAAVLMVASIAFRSCVAEIYLSRFMNGCATVGLASELVLAGCFIVTAYLANSPALTCAFVVLYYAVNHESVRGFARDFARIAGRRS